MTTMTDIAPTHADRCNATAPRKPALPARRSFGFLGSLLKRSTLIKLSVALLLPALGGCLDGSPQWARAHALQDTAAAATHALTVVQRRPAAPAAGSAAAPVKADGPALAANKAASAKASKKSRRDADLNADLGVKRLVVAHGVKSREPVSPTAAFSAGDKRIYAFVEVSNPERAESAVFVSFAKDGERERGAVRLRVGESARWRTWAYTRLAKEPGRYTALVRDGQGKLLAKAPFEVKASAEAAPVDGPAAPAADPATAAPDSPPAAAASKDAPAAASPSAAASKDAPAPDTQAADAAPPVAKPVAS